MPNTLITPERLHELANNLSMRSGTDPYVDALKAAAAEIETLKLTAEATIKLAQNAARQSVLDRRILEGIRDENSRLHNRNVDLTDAVAKSMRGMIKVAGMLLEVRGGDPHADAEVRIAMAEIDKATALLGKLGLASI